MQIAVPPRRLLPSGRSWHGHGRMHLGCGDHLPQGWANVYVDGPSGIVRHDLTRAFPLRSRTIGFVSSKLYSLVREGGFDRIERTAWRASRQPELRGLEIRPYRGELIVEGAKGRSHG